jgi:hypothetical protein
MIDQSILRPFLRATRHCSGRCTGLDYVVRGSIFVSVSRVSLLVTLNNVLGSVREHHTSILMPYKF